MNWIFLGVMEGYIVYLVVIVLDIVESFKESRAKIEAENRTASLEEEALNLEHWISELHHKINSVMPSIQEASS